MKLVTIAMACDERYLPGAIGTLASARMALDPGIAMEVFFMHESLSIPSFQRIDNVLRRIEGKTTFRFHKIEEDFSAFPEFFYPSKLTYARLLLPDLLKAERVLYLDSDILCLKPLLPLLETDLAGAALGAVVEKRMPTLAADPPVGSPISCDLRQPYFNAGLLLLDLGKARQSGLFKEAARILASYPKSCKVYDQSALNYSVDGAFLQLDPSWNVQNHYDDFRPCAALQQLKRKALNVHFVTRSKPWLEWSPFPAETMFRTLLEHVDKEFSNPQSTEMARGKQIKCRLARWLGAFYRGRSLLKGNKSGDLEAAKHWDQMHSDLTELRGLETQVTALLGDWNAEIKAKTS